MSAPDGDRPSADTQLADMGGRVARGRKGVDGVVGLIEDMDGRGHRLETIRRRAPYAPIKSVSGRERTGYGHGGQKWGVEGQKRLEGDESDDRGDSV